MLWESVSANSLCRDFVITTKIWPVTQPWWYHWLQQQTCRLPANTKTHLLIFFYDIWMKKRIMNKKKRVKTTRGNLQNKGKSASYFLLRREDEVWKHEVIIIHSRRRDRKHRNGLEFFLICFEHDYIMLRERERERYKHLNWAS